MNTATHRIIAENRVRDVNRRRNATLHWFAGRVLCMHNVSTTQQLMSGSLIELKVSLVSAHESIVNFCPSTTAS